VVAEDRAQLALERAGLDAQRRRRAVGQHDVELVDVVDGRAVDDRVAARRVVADHPADRGPVGGARIRPEAEAVAMRPAVEILLDDAGPDPHPPPVELADRAHVARRVEHHALPGGLPGQARTAAAWDDRHVEPPRDRDRGSHLGRIARTGHHQRLAGEHAGVARVQVARVRVVAHVAQLAPQSSEEVHPGTGSPASSLPDLNRHPGKVLPRCGGG
jgi:hypothetical protein